KVCLCRFLRPYRRSFQAPAEPAGGKERKTLKTYLLRKTHKAHPLQWVGFGSPHSFPRGRSVRQLAAEVEVVPLPEQRVAEGVARDRVEVLAVDRVAEVLHPRRQQQLLVDLPVGPQVEHREARRRRLAQ